MSKKKKVRSTDPPPSTLSEDEVDRILYQWSIPPEGRDDDVPPTPGAAWSEEWNQALRSMGVDPDAIGPERRRRLDRRVHSFYRDKNFERVRKERAVTKIQEAQPKQDENTTFAAKAPSVAPETSKPETGPTPTLTPSIASGAKPGGSTGLPRGFKPPKSRPGSPAAKINAALTWSPQTVEELSVKSGIASSKVKDHVKHWKRKGVIEENRFGFFWKES